MRERQKRNNRPLPFLTRDAADGDIVLLPEFGQIQVQRVGGDAAERDCAFPLKGGLLAQIDSQQGRGAFGVLSENFKKIARLIENKVVRMVYLNRRVSLKDFLPRRFKAEFVRDGAADVPP